ncbi:MAG: tRNA (adenosine(37)-N6)-threonylcarbamoyltransferase complex ATPase subunit type 1 TsaE [Candidatus Omnitrophota bacterium]|nr:tRNA (adenosine(37)-N6)-threonylcarbamoyltransferase complex ATPase subunit type 1 TsaE [Candidatus Omnitrophota bacterium]
MEAISHSVEETEQLGVELAKSLRSGDVVTLIGEIGAGKTTFVRGLALGLGVAAGSVASPSFVLVRQYTSGRMPLYHADLFRLENLPQAANVGLEECYEAGGVTLIEWANKVPGVLPEQFLEIRFEAMDPESRRLTLQPHGPLYQGRKFLA